MHVLPSSSNHRAQPSFHVSLLGTFHHWLLSIIVAISLQGVSKVLPVARTFVEVNDTTYFERQLLDLQCSLAYVNTFNNRAYFWFSGATALCPCDMWPLTLVLVFLRLAMVTTLQMWQQISMPFKHADAV